MKFFAVLTALVTLFSAGAASGQPSHFTAERIARIDAYVERSADHLNLPGVAYALIEDGRAVHGSALGRAAPGGVPVSLDTPFELGSVSKSFSAVVLLQLQAEGLVNLDAPVVRYVPAFSTQRRAQSDKITVRHLLSHRSGLSTLDGNRYQHTIYRGDDAPGRAVAKLAKVKLHFEPGEGFTYSNANFALAALVIERVAGQSFEDVLRERIFDRLGMSRSFVQVPPSDGLGKAVGHRQWFGKNVASDHQPGRMMMAAGGVVASANDLALYLVAIASQDDRILPAGSADQLFDSVPYEDGGSTGYALGWEVRKLPNGTLISHNGLNGGFSAVAGFVAEEDYGFLVLTNASSSLHDRWQADFSRMAVGYREVDYTTRSVWPILGLITILALVLVVGAVSCCVRGPSGHIASLRSRMSGLNVAVKVVAPTLLLSGIAYGLAFVAPAANGSTLRAVLVFFPDIWLGLSAGAVAAIVWAVAGLVFRLRPDA